VPHAASIVSTSILTPHAPGPVVHAPSGEALLPSTPTRTTTASVSAVAANRLATTTTPTVYMGATETCNSVDDNCDGTADDGNPGGGKPLHGLRARACARQA